MAQALEEALTCEDIPTIYRVYVADHSRVTVRPILLLRMDVRDAPMASRPPSAPQPPPPPAQNAHLSRKANEVGIPNSAVSGGNREE